jgi:hypothetical protein
MSWLHIPIIPSNQEAEAGDCKFEASLGNIMKFYPKKNKTKRGGGRKTPSAAKIFFNQQINYPDKLLHESPSCKIHTSGAFVGV